LEPVETYKTFLEKAGCERTFTDRASATKAERKGLTEALSLVFKVLTPLFSGDLSGQDGPSDT
jgi:hypothetical protein